jgi:hypothetical protein
MALGVLHQIGEDRQLPEFISRSLPGVTQPSDLALSPRRIAGRHLELSNA